MISAATREWFAPWIAMAFCAMLSLLTITSNLYLSRANGADVGSWAIVFLCNLPLCFFFVGIAMAHTQSQIRELRDQITELKMRQSG